MHNFPYITSLIKNWINSFKITAKPLVPVNLQCANNFHLHVNVKPFIHFTLTWDSTKISSSIRIP